jgi:hypothetical protein
VKAFGFIFVVALSFFVAGCSSVSVTNDYDREFNFAPVKSYQWATEAKNLISPDAQAAAFENQLIEKRFKDAVNTQLGAKGMVVDTTAPDIYVAYHTGTQQKTQVTNYGYGYGRGYGGNYDVSTYTQGTIILDFVDAKTKTLVWRSVATGALGSNPDPNTAGEKLSGIVQQMLKDYPPKPGQK